MFEAFICKSTLPKVFPIVLGDMDSNGNLNANMIHQFSKNLRTRVVAQIQESQLVGYQMTNDYKGLDFTASLTAVNNDIVQTSGVLIGQYLQRVNTNLDLGTEIILQYGRNVPNGRVAFYSFGWRYFGKQWQLSGAINPLGSLHLCYHHQSKSPIQFGVEFESNLRTMETQSVFSYQIDLNKANMTFKGLTIFCHWYGYLSSHILNNQMT
jgi:mitochondrial import receptor subunit TOM40